MCIRDRSWVWRIEAYFGEPGLIWGHLGCQPAALDLGVSTRPLAILSSLTGKTPGQLSRHRIADAVGFGRAALCGCVDCLREMAARPDGVYLRCAWAQALRTTCPAHSRPLVPLLPAEHALFHWQDGVGSRFADPINDKVLGQPLQATSKVWAELAAFEDALLNHADNPESATLLASVIRELLETCARSVGAGRLPKDLPDVFALHWPARGPVTAATLANQPPDIRRLVTAMLMKKQIRPMEWLKRESILTVSAPSGTAAMSALQSNCAHPVDHLQLKQKQGTTWPKQDKRWFQRKAEALLASDEGQRVIQLRGAARKRAFGSMMREALDAAEALQALQPAQTVAAESG